MSATTGISTRERIADHVANLVAATRRVPVVQDPLLNRLGLQVARTTAARAVRATRRAPSDTRVRELRNELRRDGVVVIDEFLSPEQLDRVVAAAQHVLEGSTPRLDARHGSNHVVSVWRSDMDDTDRDELDLLFTHPLLHSLGEAAEGWPMSPAAGRCVLQHVTQVVGIPDRESEPHSDTFYSTHKAWLYLTDVTERDGPLFYYPGSQRLDRTALTEIYRESVTTAAGARRVPDEELSRRGLRRRVLTCKANTLVVADTFGVHGRCQGHPPGERIALHVELRTEPFRRASRLPTDGSRAADSAGL